MRTTQTVLALVVCVVAVTSPSTGDRATSSELPEGFSFWTGQEPMKRWWRWQWPAAEVREAKVPRDADAAEAAMAWAEKRLRILLREDVVPADVRRYMVALDHFVPRGPAGGRVTYNATEVISSTSDQGTDRIVAQYRVNELAIFWVQHRNHLAIAVHPFARERVTALEDMRKLAEDMAQRLFGKADSPLPSVRVPEFEFRKTDYGATGRVLVGETAYVEKAPGQFVIKNDPQLADPKYSFFRVATDGLNVRFWGICTDPDYLGSPRIGWVEDWF